MVVANTSLADSKRLLSYPPTLRRGTQELIKVAPNPAAGANFTYRISGDYWERILACSLTAAISPSGPQRTIALSYQDGDAFTFDQVAVAANLTAPVTSTFYGDLQPTSVVSPIAGLQAEGSQTSPGANTAITSIASTAGGTYQVYAIVTMSGTLAAGTDNNNIQLYNGGATVYATLDNSIQLTPQIFGPYDITLPPTGQIIAKNLAAGTAASVYSVELIANPIGVANHFTLPDITLEPGWQLQFSVGNIQGTDQLSGISFLRERYSSRYARGIYEDERESAVREALSYFMGS